MSVAYLRHRMSPPRPGITFWLCHRHLNTASHRHAAPASSSSCQPSDLGKIERRKRKKKLASRHIIAHLMAWWAGAGFPTRRNICWPSSLLKIYFLECVHLSCLGRCLIYRLHFVTNPCQFVATFPSAHYAHLQEACMQPEYGFEETLTRQSMHHSQGMLFSMAVGQCCFLLTPSP